MSDAGMAAVSAVAETYVVVRFAPFQRTTELVTKSVPLTVNTKASPPAVVELWLRAAATGIGLPPGATTVKALPLVTVPPGAVTLRGPVVAPAGAVAVICVLPFTVNEEAEVPLNFTAVAPAKPLPLMVTTVPAGPLEGVKPLITGAGDPPTGVFMSA